MIRRAWQCVVLAVCVCVVLMAGGAAALAEDWPTARHDNQRTGVSGETLRPPLALAWTFVSPAPPADGWAMPVNGYGARKTKPNVSYDDAFRVIAVGDSCYFSSSAENCVYAVNAATGAVRWRVFTDAAPRLAPAYWKGRLYVGSDDGVFRCLDARDGKLVWQVRAAPRDDLVLGHGRFSSVWPIRAGGIVDDGVAYFTAGLFPSEQITFFAVRADDGKVLWRRPLDEMGQGVHVPQGTILATADSLFTTSRTAPARWRKSDGEAIDFNTPFPDVKNAHEYRFLNGGSGARIWNGRHIVYGRGAMLGYDPDAVLKDKYGRSKRGGLLFNWFGARAMVFGGKRAYVATDTHVLAVDPGRLGDLARTECRQFEQAYKAHRVASYLDHLDSHRRAVAAHGADSPQARRIENGPLKWGKANWDAFPAVAEAIFARLGPKCRWMTPLKANEAMILAGSVLYLGADDGVYALDAGDGRRLWHARTGSRVRGLALAGGRLYVSTIDGKVRCFHRGRSGRAAGAGRPTPVATAASRARDIIIRSGVRKGYCLLLGGRDGLLACELARTSDLHVEMYLDNDTPLAPIREMLATVGLYGSRVCVRSGPCGKLPYPPYVFNLVVDDSAPGRVPLAEALRVTRPCGGVLLTRSPAGAKTLAKAGATAVRDGATSKITRGRVPGSRDWTHNYATPGNTSCSADAAVRGPFGVLWYGRPGPRQRIDRHAAPPIPLVVGGMMFTLGTDRVMAYDLYNGLLHWRREIRGATRTGLPIDASNLVADATSLFLAVDDGTCLRLDGRSGRTTAHYVVPVRPGGKASQWAWIARAGKLLYGSRRTGSADKTVRKQTSEAIFALNVETGATAWTVPGDRIDHGGIALADRRVFCLDRRLTADQRREAMRQTVGDPSVPDRKAVDRHGKVIEPDLRKLVALDAVSGKVLWSRPLNLTDVTLDDTIVQGRGAAACMAADGVVLVHGTGSLGHPHKEFLAGKFARRALYAFDARTGRVLWGGRKGYRKRPIIVGRTVYAEPFAWDLKTGRIRTVANPLSGREQVLDYHRGYIGCGHLLASASTIFGARGGVSHYALDGRSGFVPFAGMALACGLGAAPAGGVLAVPEGRSGCTCATSIYTSIALYPRPGGPAWGIGFAGGRADVHTMPVKHVSINLGAPGYRDGADGQLWIPYPARVDAGPLGTWLPTYQHNASMCYRLDGLRTEIAGTNEPWLFTSGYSHDKPLRFRLIDKGGPPATYTVRLYFAEPYDLAPGRRVFTVRLQGKAVLADLDVVKLARGPRRALVKEIKGVRVTDTLQIQLVGAPSSKAKPILSAFQAIRE